MYTKEIVYSLFAKKAHSKHQLHRPTCAVYVHGRQVEGDNDYMQELETSEAQVSCKNMLISKLRKSYLPNWMGQVSNPDTNRPTGLEFTIALITWAPSFGIGL